MKRTRVQYFLALAVLGLASCGEKPDARLSEHTRLFWHSVFKEDMQAAYDMLSSESKSETTLEEFSQRVDFCPYETDISGDFRKAYAQRCRVSILAVEAKRKHAEVQVILTLPSLEELKLNLDTQRPKDADSTWVYERLREALITGQTPSNEMRVNVTWIKEGNTWAIALD